MLVGPNNKKLGPAFWMSLGIFFPVFSSNTFYFILQEYLSAMDRGKKQNKTEAKCGLFFPDAFMREELEGWGVDWRGVWCGGRGSGLLLLMVMIFILRNGEI